MTMKHDPSGPEQSAIAQTTNLLVAVALLGSVFALLVGASYPGVGPAVATGVVVATTAGLWPRG